MHCINELCYILIISISNFLIFIHFTNWKTLKPSLAQNLKLIFKFNTIMGQINIPLWTHMRHKGWRKDGKTFARCYNIIVLNLNISFNSCAWLDFNVFWFVKRIKIRKLEIEIISIWHNSLIQSTVKFLHYVMVPCCGSYHYCTDSFN